MKNPDNEIRRNAPDLFIALFEKSHGFAEAQEVINLINNDYSLKHARYTAKVLQEALNQAQANAKESEAKTPSASTSSTSKVSQ
jgi:hypothetical protein